MTRKAVDYYYKEDFLKTYIYFWYLYSYTYQ